MTTKLKITRRRGLGRRWIAWLAILSVCLNALLPTAVTAANFSDSDVIVICTPDGYQNVRVGSDGQPLHEQRVQQGHDCTLCLSCGPFAAPVEAAHFGAASDVFRTTWPDRNPAHPSPERRGRHARAPPHFG